MPSTTLKVRPVLQGLVLVVAYVGTGKLGVKLHSISGFSPLIWLPSGIGLASLVLFNRKLWPAIFTASLILHVWLGQTIPVSLFLAAGATVEGVTGAFLLDRFCGARPTLTRVREVLAFFLLVMGLSTFLSSAIEVGSLSVFGVISRERFFTTWRTWWLGESMGMLVFAGTAICWWNDIRQRLKTHWKLRYEAIFLLIAITGTCIFVYTPLAQFNNSVVIRPYFLFSLMIWASLRFDVLGATTTTLIMTSSVIAGALQGFVPATTVAVDDRMVIQQFFALALGTTGLILASALREKDEAVEARSEFISIASHELKTPITSISLHLQVAERKLTHKDADKTPAEIEQLALITKTQQQMKKLTQIVEQLLDVARMDRNRINLHFEEVDLSQLISRLLERLSSNLANVGCSVQLDLQPGITCQWDMFRFEQVLENILSNVIKYAPNQPVKITTREKDGRVEIQVSDRGPGIEESKQKQVFERFVRANSSPYVNGLGLGLFITRQIVEAHHGRVWIESKLGQGSTFHVSAPCDPSQFTQPKQPHISA